MTAPGHGPGFATGLGPGDRTHGVSFHSPGALADDIVVLDLSRAVVLDLACTCPEPEWRACCTSAAAGFTWPAATRIKIDRRGTWHAELGRGPGCRWSSWSLPEVHEMITRATGVS